MFMDFGYKEPSLLFQEIPLYGHLCRKGPIQEIYVQEGVDAIDGIENASFSERGGGVSLDLGGITRMICWQTSDNALELHEYSLDADLHSNHFSIIFEDSKILPEVHITVKNHHLVIVCCTIHAAHFISLDISQQNRTIKDVKAGQSHSSLLKSLPHFDFDNPQYNYAFGHQVSGIACGFTAKTMLPGNANVVTPLLGTIIAISTASGNLVIVRMPGKGSPSHFMINQSSRMSRLWSGINPWAESGGSETVEDMKMLMLSDNPCVVAICMDRRLRIWSCRTHELLASENIAQHLPVDSKTVESQAFVYKIRTCGDANLVSIYFGMLEECRFLQFKIHCKSDNGINLEFVSSVASPLASTNFPSRHLVDYVLTDKTVLFALWHDVEDVDSVTVCNINNANWHEVATYPAPMAEIPVQPYQDIREAYMDYIFHPGRFSPLAITRALSIQRRSSPTPSSSMQQQTLKQRVSSHIQNETQAQLPEEESNDDFAALQETVWSDFYQTCIQYQQVVSRCLGMTVPLSSNASSAQQIVTLVKKGHFSVLTPVSSLEAVCRGADPSIFVGILPEEACTDLNLRDLSQLLECLGVFHSLLGIEFLESIQQSLSLSGTSPADVVAGVLNDVYDMIRKPEDIIGPEAMLNDMYDVSAVIELLIIILEPTEFGVDFEAPDTKSWPTGSIGIELLARCVFRHIENRFQLTILLYILSCVLENDKDHRTILSSRVGTYVQAYQAACWLSTVKKQNISQTTLEKTMQNLSVYDTTDSITGGSQSQMSSYGKSSDITLLEFFITGEGGKLLKAFLKAARNPEFQISPNTPEYLSRPYDGHSLHPKIVPAVVNFFVYLIWPLGPTLTFPDFLLCQGHLSVLQRYLQRELGGWCDRCPGSRAYMLAHCHLHHGNYDKAVRYFVTAAPAISKEEYLNNKLLQEEEDGSPSKILEVIYYTKVLPIFEKLDLPEQVITLAEHAVEVAKNNENDPNVPILWSSIFRQNNSLLRHSAAFKAILSNPDPDHRKDCLRALAVCLCECKQYKTLVEFEYGELEDDLVSILEHRARGTDLAFSNHKYYDILYAFHIHRGSYRRAASSMYEQGYRLGCEMSPSGPAAVNNASMLERQAACFLACINCLYLVSEDDRWILHPTAGQNNDGVQHQLGCRSPKRQYDGEEVEQQSSRKVVIKELVDIEKETLLIETRVKLELLNKDKKQPLTGPLTIPFEIIALLCRMGLYDDAILLSSKFDMSIVPIFESLASKCVRLSYADERGISEGWNWLQENETAKTHCFSAASSSSQCTAADAAYRLLQVYLERHGNAELKGTTYYYAAAKALFSLSAALPAWFSNSYKLRNCPELLRLLVCFDRLHEATRLAIELINAAMGVGPELFGIKESLSGSGKPTLLPYTIIEQLLHILDESRMHDDFDVLNDTLEEYLYAVETVSHDMIQAAHQRAFASR